VEYIDRSQTHECGNWDWGRAVSFLGIHKVKFLQCVYRGGADPSKTSAEKVWASSSIFSLPYSLCMI
jgi:hypothetical protein